MMEPRSWTKCQYSSQLQRCSSSCLNRRQGSANQHASAHRVHSMYAACVASSTVFLAESLQHVSRTLQQAMAQRASLCCAVHCCENA